MILTTTKKILIVPDFGNAEAAEHLLPLMEAIKEHWNFDAKIIDLRQMVIDENPDKKLNEVQILDLAASRLNALAADKSIVWDKPIYSDDYSEPDLSSYETEPEPENDYGEPAGYSAETKPKSEEERIIRKDRLAIRVSRASDDYLMQGTPNAIVVFGKSVMLAGGVRNIPVLFIDPVYDNEWPWKKQYYADRKLVGQYHCDKYEYENGYMETVLWCGTECTSPWKYSRRYGIVTNKDYIGEFWDRYPQLAEVNRGLEDNVPGLAEFICEFADDKMSFPLEEVYEAIRNLRARDIHSLNKICDFTEPVILADITALGIWFGVPMSNGQSCYKLRVTDTDYTLPLERVNTRRDLNTLRDAIVRAGENTRKAEPEQKRILIVPDYFTPYDAPMVKELYECLKRKGYYVAVYVHGNTLEKSRQGIEHRCKVKPFDLIVTLETGCLLATRITNCPRIFVNPDWNVWESMKSILGNANERIESRQEGNSSPFFTYYINKNEVVMARQMAERANIKRGKELIYGWLSTDADPELSEEHLKRFNTALHIPHFKITTGYGIDVFARQIHNILTFEDD